MLPLNMTIPATGRTPIQSPRIKSGLPGCSGRSSCADTRDVTQRTGGRWLGIAAILAGAALSWALSSPHLAVASGVTYLCSETLDIPVYTPLQRRRFVPAVIASGCAAIVLDSVLFLHLAGLYSTPLVEGLILGKFWVIATAGPVTCALRNKAPVAAAA
jgi:queuosine precursor transporter